MFPVASEAYVVVCDTKANNFIYLLSAVLKTYSSATAKERQLKCILTKTMKKKKHYYLHQSHANAIRINRFM